MSAPQFLTVSPIGSGDVRALPVKDLAPTIAYCESRMGFSLVARDATTATLKRDDVEIGLVVREDHEPGRAGSCYISVRDVVAVWREFEDRGAKPGAIEVQEHGGEHYRLFFIRECDLPDYPAHNGYCFCFGQSA